MSVRETFRSKISGFKISNRMGELVGPGVPVKERRLSRAEVKILGAYRILRLKKTLKIPKFSTIIAWFCFFIWVLGAITIIFIWGVNMNSDATEMPHGDLVKAATSYCDPRDTISGEALSVDVAASDAVNLEGAQNTADETNENFEKYGHTWVCDIISHDLVPETWAEDHRFLASSLYSWVVGTVLLPIPHYLISAIMLSLLYGWTDENKQLRQLLELEDEFPVADLNNFTADEQLFLLCIWPEALLKILESPIPGNERKKIKSQTVSKMTSTIEILAHAIF